MATNDRAANHPIRRDYSLVSSSSSLVVSIEITLVRASVLLHFLPSVLEQHIARTN